MYLRKQLIVIKENTYDKKIEIKLNSEIFTSSLVNKFFKPNMETAPRVGIESKKDILAASNLLKFKNLAAVIEIPDLLTPGTKESI